MALLGHLFNTSKGVSEVINFLCNTFVRIESDNRIKNNLPVGDFKSTTKIISKIQKHARI